MMQLPLMTPREAILFELGRAQGRREENQVWMQAAFDRLASLSGIDATAAPTVPIASPPKA